MDIQPMIKRILIRFLFLLGGLCISTSTYSANISITESINDKYILIEGNIEKGDYEKFIEAVLKAGSSARHVFIASKGGVAVEAIKIGKLIRSLHYATEVPYYYTSEGEGAYCKSSFPIPKSNCQCSSSCVLIYLAGIERNGDYLGIHRTFINHKQLKNLSLQQAKKYSIQISAYSGEREHRFW